MSLKNLAEALTVSTSEVLDRVEIPEWIQEGSVIPVNVPGSTAEHPRIIPTGTGHCLYLATAGSVILTHFAQGAIKFGVSIGNLHIRINHKPEPEPDHYSFDMENGGMDRGEFHAWIVREDQGRLIDFTSRYWASWVKTAGFAWDRAPVPNWIDEDPVRIIERHDVNYVSNPETPDIIRQMERDTAEVDTIRDIIKRTLQLI